MAELGIDNPERKTRSINRIDITVQRRDVPLFPRNVLFTNSEGKPVFFRTFLRENDDNLAWACDKKESRQTRSAV